MLSSQVGVTLLLCVTAAAAAPGATAGQAQELASRKPRFLAAWTLPGKTVDIRSAEVLLRRVSLELGDVTVDDALKEITRQADLEISYSKELLPRKLVSLHVREITVAAALTEVLLDAGLDIALTRTGQMAVVRRSPEAKPAAPDTGTIAGRVTDRGTGAPLVGATVTLEGTRLTATTNNEGRYRLGRVAEGTYTLRARYIGYTPATAPTTVSAGAEAQADFVLAKSVQQLDQVVVTGTVVPTEVKALPNPISVITAEDIDQQRPDKTVQLLRRAVPSAVAWDFGKDPEQTALSVRGASSLNPGAGAMKVLLDGIEVTDRSVAVIDPNSIERLEVIRGPQAAAVYGADAIGGVIQVFTKRGAAGMTRPQIEAEAGLGTTQSPYAGSSGSLRQVYSASVRGGIPNATYAFGGGYTKSGEWVPHDGTSVPSVYGGVSLTQGPMVVDLSARYFEQNTGGELDPRLAETGFSYVSKPFYQALKFQEQTYGAHVTFAPVSFWRNVVTAGIDRLAIDARSTQARLTTPADTFMLVLASNQSKTSIGYNTSLMLHVGEHLSATTTAGIDHYALRSDGYFTLGALATAGSIPTDPAQPPSASRDVSTNTGYFAQGQVNVYDAVFVTGALRADNNSNFGSGLGTPLSPRGGISVVRDVGRVTVKVRGGYGEAIHPPGPGQKDASVFALGTRAENPELGPERQSGWDTGVDFVFGSWGSLSGTYYNQTARDLIQLVLLDPSAVPQTYQFQNVARVKNSGVELDARLRASGVDLSAQYAYTRSEVRDLGPNYTGDLRVGDQVPYTPRHTAGATLTVTPLPGTSISGGISGVGKWIGTDYAAQFMCFAGTGPCRSSSRDYQATYPGFVKLNISIRQRLTRTVAVFAIIDNLTNNEAYEFQNTVPVVGRITTLGVRATY